MSDYYDKMLEYTCDPQMAEELSKRIKDIAAFFGYPINHVYENICKCFEGDCGPLRMYGIAVKPNHPHIIHKVIMADSVDAAGDFDRMKDTPLIDRITDE